MKLTTGTFNKTSFLNIGVTDMRKATAAPAPAPQTPTERSHGFAPCNKESRKYLAASSAAGFEG
jgi:hypothetical protein